MSRHLAPFDGLIRGQVESGDVVLLWTAAADAPVDVVQDVDGVTLLLGDAIAPGASQRTDARALRDAWTASTAAGAAHDGFHAAIAVRHDVVMVGGDLLGLFPLYFASRDDCCIASSSPRAFEWHSRFDGPLELAGLFGYLLTGGPFDGGTLRRGVRRLEAGTRVRWHPRTGTQEERGYVLPRAHADASLSFDAQLERLDAAQESAVRRHTALHPRLSVLLSGGRDSRTLVGYLARAGRAAAAVSLGVATDHDATCAAAVARALSMPHRLHDVAFARFPEFADRTLAYERLAGGMSSVHSWGAVDALREAGGAVLSGYVFEIRQIPPLPSTREGMLAWTHAHAMAPESLAALVRPAHRDTVGAVMDAVRARYDGLAIDAEDGAEASWRWLMSGYARFHAGAVPWRLSFASWPVLPILDQALLEVMCTIPREHLGARRMQDALLRARFPALARLPLDRNADDLQPLVDRRGSGPLSRLRTGVRARVGGSRRGETRGASTTPMVRRYYARMYDFDNPGWQRIRADAEAGRAALSEWFEPAALAALVPPPTVAVAHADPIAQGFAPKMLAGLMRLMGSARGDPS